MVGITTSVRDCGGMPSEKSILGSAAGVTGVGGPAAETVLIQGDEAAMKKWLGDHASRFDSIFIDKKMVQRSWL